MELNEAEQRGGIRWFWGAGAFAVLLSIWLAHADYKLSTSDSEKVLGATLKELRTAQTTLPSGVTDTRQTMPFLNAAKNSDNEPIAHGH